MFNLNPRNFFKAIAISLGCLLCASAIAQDKQVVIVKPGERNKGKIEDFDLNLIRDTFVEFFNTRDGYTVVDTSHTDQILEEHMRQRKGLTRQDEIREFGAQLGADYICTTTIDYSENKQEYNIHCAFLNVVSGAAMASINRPQRNLHMVDAKGITELSRSLIAELISAVEKTPSARPVNQRAVSTTSSLLAGLDTDISREINRRGSNAKWNDLMAQRYSISVDTKDLSIRQEEKYFVASGYIRFALLGPDGYETNNYDVYIGQASAFSAGEVKQVIRRQFKTQDIINKLLAD